MKARGYSASDIKRAASNVFAVSHLLWPTLRDWRGGRNPCEQNEGAVARRLKQPWRDYDITRDETSQTQVFSMGAALIAPARSMVVNIMR
jgi:hypothetical protein